MKRNAIARPRIWRLALGAWLVAAGVAAQDPAAERLLGEAERLALGGDPAAAAGELKLLVERFPGDRTAPRALLRLAELERDGGDVEAARDTLRRLLDDHARAPEAAEGLVLQARLLLASAASTQDLAAAQNVFRRVSLLFGREAYPALEARLEARIASGELALQTGDPATAAAELVAALEDEPPAPAHARARLALARAWLATGDWRAAASVLEETAANDESAPRAAARQLLSLIHRRLLRPLAGERPWLTSGRFPPAGADLREPSGVAAAADGRLLIVDARLPLVLLLAADGHEIARQSLDDVSAPGWLSSGHPFVVAGGGVTLPFDATTYAFSEPGKGAPLKNLVTAAPGTFGDWFVAARGSRNVLHIPAGRPGSELLAASRPEVVDLAYDAEGRIYALDERQAEVTRIGRDGASEGVVASGDWKKPAALALDALGNLYVLDRGHRTVDLIAPDGRRLAQVGPDLGGGIELRNPVDVAVDGGGRLFIADTRLPFVVMLD